MTALRRFAPEMLFWAVFAAVVVAQLLVVIPGITVMRLWEDEALNLTVPINLLAGLGYTSDGTLSGSQLAPFDPRISTGPIVLLPITAVLALGGDLVYGARAVMLIFYIGLLAGLWMLGRRIGAASGSAAAARWAGLAAMAVPLGLNTWDSASPMQSPVDVLGEVPAAALIVWALYFAQSKPWLAGLFVGLAMQAKTIGALGAPAVAVAVFLAVPGTFWARAWQLVRCGLVALIPIVLFEICKLIALGPAGYVQLTREFLGFVRSGGQSVEPVAPGDKLGALLGSWFVPLPLILAVLLLALLVAALVWFTRDSRPARLPRETVVLLAAALVGLATWVGWWAVSSHTPVWIRHPSPGLFAFVPLLAAFLVLGIALLWRQRGSGAAASAAAASAVSPSAAAALALRVAAVAASVALFASLAIGVQGHLNIADHVRYNEPLAAQREAALAVAELGEPILASSWGPEVAIAVLAGSHTALSDAPGFEATTRVVRNYDTSKAGVEAFEAALDAACSDVPVRSGAYVVCIPRG